MDTKFIKNLLIKVSVDGNYSICDTCIHQDDDKTCVYNIKNKCTNNLEEYIPDIKKINA